MLDKEIYGEHLFKKEGKEVKKKKYTAVPRSPLLYYTICLK